MQDRIEYSVWTNFFGKSEKKKSYTDRHTVGWKKWKKIWRPNGAFGPYGFSKKKSNHIGFVIFDLLIMVYEKIPILAILVQKSTKEMNIYNIKEIRTYV